MLLIQDLNARFSRHCFILEDSSELAARGLEAAPLVMQPACHWHICADI